MRLALFLIAFTALAQSTDPVAQAAEIEARFTSATAPDLAWAARLTADYGHGQFIPRVITLIQHDEFQVRDAALDALIVLKADVPNDIVEKLVRQNNDAGFIFAALHPEDHKNLLHLLDGTQDDKTWLTLNSIFLATSPPGYAARLFRQWTMPVQVLVSDPGVKANRSYEVSLSSSCGIAARASTGDSNPYPIWRRHVIQEAAPGRGTVLALGPHPLVYGYDNCIFGMTYVPRGEFTFDFLRALGYARDPLPVPEIHYVSAAQYRQAAASELAKVRAYVKRLRTALIDGGKLPANDQTTPQLKVTVDDQRTNRKTPLPQLDWSLR